MGRVAERLGGRDLRSIGDANAVSRELLREGSLVKEAVALLSSDDPILRARSADALEKASLVRPAILRPHKAALLQLAGAARQQEVVWHLAQMLPRLELSAVERRTVQGRLRTWLAQKSRIVAVCALQGLWELARSERGVDRSVRALVMGYARKGPPSLRARARRLLRRHHAVDNPLQQTRPARMEPRC